MQFFANANYDLCEFFQVPKVALGKNPLYIQALSYCGKNIGDFIASYMDFCYKSLAGQTKNIDQTEKIK